MFALVAPYTPSTCSRPMHEIFGTGSETMYIYLMGDNSIYVMGDNSNKIIEKNWLNPFN